MARARVMFDQEKELQKIVSSQTKRFSELIGERRYDDKMYKGKDGKMHGDYEGNN